MTEEIVDRRDPRLALLAASLLLIGVALLSLPEAAFTVLHPNLRFPTDRTGAWCTLVLAPLVLVLGIGMLRRAFPHGFQFSIKTLFVVTAVAALLCWIAPVFL